MQNGCPHVMLTLEMAFPSTQAATLIEQKNCKRFGEYIILHVYLHHSQTDLTSLVSLLHTLLCLVTYATQRIEEQWLSTIRFFTYRASPIVQHAKQPKYAVTRANRISITVDKTMQLKTKTFQLKTKPRVVKLVQINTADCKNANNRTFRVVHVSKLVILILLYQTV